MAAQQSFVILLATLVLTAMPWSPLAAAGLLPNRVGNACCPIEYAAQRLDGYLGERMSHNTRDELLVFPLDKYLWPYTHGGKTNGTFPVDEYLGKYMHAMAIACQYEPAPVREGLKQRMDRIKDVWLAYQKGSGFCITRHEWKTPEWGDRWDAWNSKYVLLGLLEYYQQFPDPKVLNAAKRLGDSFTDSHGPSKHQLNYLDGVMLELMVLLYRLTGAARYRDYCQWMMDNRLRDKVVDELLNRSGRVDRIPDCHAYVVESCLISILDLYLLDGGPKEYLEACRVGVDDIVKNRWYVTGGTGQIEYFRDNHLLAGTDLDSPQEACAVAHFIALCRKLFYLTADPKYVDYLETALYNSALGGKNPRNSFLTAYFCPLQGHKLWKQTDHTNGVPCCTCSMCREIARIPEIFAARFAEGGPCLLLYNPGSFRCLAQPFGGPFRARVAGQDALAGKPGTFLHIDRQWSRGDEVEVDMNMPVRVLQGGESYPSCLALVRGPQVLAVDQRLNPSVRSLDALRIDRSRATQLFAEPRSRLPEGWVGARSTHRPVCASAGSCWCPMPMPARCLTKTACPPGFALRTAGRPSMTTRYATLAADGRSTSSQTAISVVRRIAPPMPATRPSSRSPGPAWSFTDTPPTTSTAKIARRAAWRSI